MRESCLECILKHLGEATVLMTEVELGYPWHKWYAVGHLAEAESESIMDFPEIAKKIREFRLAYMKGEKVDMDILIDWIIGIYEEHEKKNKKSNTIQMKLDDYEKWKL